MAGLEAKAKTMAAAAARLESERAETAAREEFLAGLERFRTAGPVMVRAWCDQNGRNEDGSRRTVSIHSGSSFF